VNGYAAGSVISAADTAATTAAVGFGTLTSWWPEIG